jgi:hypothetical protein
MDYIMDKCITMETYYKYQVKLYSKVECGTIVCIAFLVNTPMSSKQLKTYYECTSLKISDVEVLEVVK